MTDLTVFCDECGAQVLASKMAVHRDQHLALENWIDHLLQVVKIHNQQIRELYNKLDESEYTRKGNRPKGERGGIGNP